MDQVCLVKQNSGVSTSTDAGNEFGRAVLAWRKSPKDSAIVSASLKSLTILFHEKLTSVQKGISF